MPSPISTPESCLAAVFHAPNRPLELRQFPIPPAGPGEAVVRIDCCTLCGSDLHTISGARREPTPTILGHEILGTISAVGDPPPTDLRGDPLRPGDRVTWSVCVACGRCDRCQRGLPQKCRSVAKYGHLVAEGDAALSGGLAESILLRAGSSIVKLPAGIEDRVLCPASCATATIAAVLRAAGPIAGRRVLVLGAGLLGLTAAAMADAGDAAEVIVCDRDQARLDLARRFGADTVDRPPPAADPIEDRAPQPRDGQADVDIVVEVSGAAEAVEYAFQRATVGATIVMAGSVMASRPVAIDPQSLVRRCLAVRGVHNYAPEDLLTAVEFLQRFHDRYPFAEVAAPTYPLAQINEAVGHALQARPIRVAIQS